MTLLKYSLIAAPVAVLALAGCGPKTCDTGTSCDSSTNSGDTDTDTDTDTMTSDTAIGYVYYAGDAQTHSGAFVDGHFGYNVVNSAGSAICTDLSEWSDDGNAPAGGCPGCNWSFELGLANGTATGSECGNLLPSALVGGEWDGFTGSWGEADTYQYDYNGTPLTFTTVLFYYSTYTGNEGWFPLAYSYGSYANTSGDASSITFQKYAGYMYYYP